MLAAFLNKFISLSHKLLFTLHSEVYLQMAQVFNTNVTDLGCLHTTSKIYVAPPSSQQPTHAELFEFLAVFFFVRGARFVSVDIFFLFYLHLRSARLIEV